MIRAAIDPGSRRLACTVTRDDGPSAPCNFLDAIAIEVGQWREFGPSHPKYRKPKVVDDVETYTPLGEHVATQDDRDVAADALAAFLTRWDVEACDVETVDRIYARTPQEGSAVSGHMLAARETVTRALTLWGAARTARGLTAPRVAILASTWRARLNQFVKDALRAAGKPVKGVLITRSTGGALDAVFAAHVPGWHGASRWTAEEAGHIRDSTGLALACGLPALEASRKASAGPRKPRTRGATKRGPRGTRARAEMPPAKAEAYRVTDRARYARTVGVEKATARAATGCNCKAEGAPTTGRHKAWCVAHKGAPRVESTCPKCSRLYAVHPRRDVCPA